MIFCCYHEITNDWTNNELRQKMAPIPGDIQQKILSKKNHLDVQLSVGGNLLILEVLKHFDLDLSLADIVYNDYRRPCFNTGFDFNVSHSGNKVVCCGTDMGKVGIDIELATTIDFDYGDYFTATEQHHIRVAKDTNTEFFKFWARKEALLKAVGTGFYTPLLNMDVSADSFIYEGVTYYLSPISIHSSYQSCIAHTVKQEIVMQQVAI